MTHESIQIQWPWTMVPFEAIDKIADDVKVSLGVGHPLFRKDLEPYVMHEEKHMLIIESEGKYYVMDYEHLMVHNKKTIPTIHCTDDLITAMTKFQ
jgi:GTP:adenosylcobinamide-phosphate guanylyltransferase